MPNREPPRIFTKNKKLTRNQIWLISTTPRLITESISSCPSLRLSGISCSTTHRRRCKPNEATILITSRCCTSFWTETPNWWGAYWKPITFPIQTVTSGTCYGQAQAARASCMKDSMNSKESTTSPWVMKSRARTDSVSISWRHRKSTDVKNMISFRTLMFYLVNSTSSTLTSFSFRRRNRNGIRGS